MCDFRGGVAYTFGADQSRAARGPHARPTPHTSVWGTPKGVSLWDMSFRLCVLPSCYDRGLGETTFY
ncbi:MAG: hypothetical protein IKZ52_02355 [Bacteroidales bacterium]|nr:hypothetical protein [Bacteroidales bacterium]